MQSWPDGCKAWRAGTARALPRPLASIDRMFLRGIEAHGRHGVHDFERAEGQRFLVDIEWWIDTAAASRHDELASTLCYTAVFETVRAIVTGPPCALIETLAERIASVLLGDFPAIRALEVTVHKPDAPIDGRFADVGISIFRER